MAKIVGVTLATEREITSCFVATVQSVSRRQMYVRHAQQEADVHGSYQLVRRLVTVRRGRRIKRMVIDKTGVFGRRDSNKQACRTRRRQR